MTGNLADGHCHLDQLPDPTAEIEAAARQGVTRILSCSEDQQSMKRTLALGVQFPGIVLPGLGLHPARVTYLSDVQIAEGLACLEFHLGEASFVGEVGLDYRHAVTVSAQERQRRILSEQLVLAGRAGLSVCLHSRRAQREVLTVGIRHVETWGTPVLLHWFTQSTRLVRAACEAPGIFVSAGPSVLSSADTRKVVAAIASSRLLLETDAPVVFGGEEARPAWIPRLVHAVAPLYGMSEGELVIQLDENLRHYLYALRPCDGANHCGGPCP